MLSRPFPGQPSPSPSGPGQSVPETSPETACRGARTVCGALIPQTAMLTRATPDWPGHVSCYNCAYRCVPPGYVQPRNGQDFPLRRECPHRPAHGIDPRSCATCTPSSPQTAQNWPCPNGCTDPAGHDPRHRYTRCTVFPPGRPAGPDGRCAEGCESKDLALRRANPRLHLDLADSAVMVLLSLPRRGLRELPDHAC